MIDTPMDKLGFPFYGFADEAAMEDMDLSFSYHILIKDKPTKDEEGNEILVKVASATCNDIPCSMCCFDKDCESGKNKSKTLIEYAKDKFPELDI